MWIIAVIFAAGLILAFFAGFSDVDGSTETGKHNDNDSYHYSFFPEDDLEEIFWLAVAEDEDNRKNNNDDD